MKRRRWQRRCKVSVGWLYGEGWSLHAAQARRSKLHDQGRATGEAAGGCSAGDVFLQPFEHREHFFRAGFPRAFQDGMQLLLGHLQVFCQRHFRAVPTFAVGVYLANEGVEARGGTFGHSKGAILATARRSRQASGWPGFTIETSAGPEAAVAVGWLCSRRR